MTSDVNTQYVQGLQTAGCLQTYNVGYVSFVSG